MPTSCLRPLVTDEDGHAEFMRAVVIITEKTVKGTARHPQEYSNPLLPLDGKQYAVLNRDWLSKQLIRMVGIRSISKMERPTVCEKKA